MCGELNSSSAGKSYNTTGINSRNAEWQMAVVAYSGGFLSGRTVVLFKFAVRRICVRWQVSLEVLFHVGRHVVSRFQGLFIEGLEKYSLVTTSMNSFLLFTERAFCVFLARFSGFYCVWDLVTRFKLNIFRDAIPCTNMLKSIYS